MPKLNTRLVNLTGQTFGRLTVLRDTRLRCKGRAHGRRGWICQCICGNEIAVMHGTLTSGNTRSCGCLGRELTILRNKKGRSLSAPNAHNYPEYQVWCSMKDRCYCPTDDSYKNYGERGIVVCNRWLKSFWNFLEDMGQRPDATYSIDRIDNNGNYEPHNCRWANRFTQNQNTRQTVMLTHNGETLCQAEWGRRLNTSAATISGRIRNGWNIQDAVTLPVNSHKSRK